MGREGVGWGNLALIWLHASACTEHLGVDAARIACPVLFQQKWDDELFTRDGQIALFDKIGDARKWLHVYPGPHDRVHGQQLDDLETFMFARLATSG